jgi:hypothetical protein
VFWSSLTELMQWGLRGAALPRRRGLALRAGAVLGFLAFFVIVISEFIGAEQGLGYLINTSTRSSSSGRPRPR